MRSFLRDDVQQVLAAVCLLIVAGVMFAGMHFAEQEREARRLADGVDIASMVREVR